MDIRQGFMPLFNGKDLTGWIGDATLWKVEDGTLVGRSVERLDHNDFLRTKEEYANFIMYAEVRLRGFNSGIQFRSIARENGRMAGYQADIGDGCWGALYEEGLRGHLVHYKPQIVEPILRPNDWNEYGILAV